MLWTIARDFLVNLAASAAADLSSPTGMMGWIVTLGAIVFVLIGWHRRRVAEEKRGLDSLYFIAPALIVSCIAMVGAAYGIGLRGSPKKAQVTTGSAPIIEQWRLEKTLIEKPLDPIFKLNAVFSRSIKHIVMYVDADVALPHNPPVRRSIKIYDASGNFEKGEALSVPVASQFDGDVFRFGSPNYGPPGDIRFSFYENIKAKIVIKDGNDDPSPQVIGFMVIPKFTSDDVRRAWMRRSSAGGQAEPSQPGPESGLTNFILVTEDRWRME